MKNKLTKLLVLILSILAITCFAFACTPKEDDEPQHTHEYSEEYTFDSEFHWYECGCGEKRATEQHVFVDGVCVCGYEKPDDGDNPAINPDTPVEPSNPSNPSEPSNPIEPSKPSNPDNPSEPSSPSTPTHTHNYQTVNYDEDNHWDECSCGDKKGVTAHVLVDGVCACGYGKSTEGVEYEVVGDHAEVTWYEGTSTKVVIAKTYKGLPVTSIGGSAFHNCSSLTSMMIPDGVTVIGAGAFNGCSSLTSITIPDSVTRIGDLAFSGCKSLQYNEYDNAYYLGNKNNEYVALIDAKSKDITSCAINENCKVLYEWAFYNCTSLTSITIPDGVTYIGWSAFYFCKSLKNVTIPDSVTKIGDTAFFNCESLTSITIPDSVTSIGLGVFNYCNSLTSIRVDENNKNYKSIDGNLYSKDGKTLVQYATGKKDTSFTIPDGVTDVGHCAFLNCSSLTSVTIPDDVTSIESYAFCYCESLTSISVDENNQNYKSIDGNLYSKDGKTLIQYAIGKKDTSFTIPDGVTDIGGSAFWYCTSLTSIMIPDGVTNISWYAFYNCGSLTSITFEDANGWYVGGVLIDVTDNSKNAIYFTSEYVGYNWYKNVDANNKG